MCVCARPKSTYTHILSLISTHLIDVSNKISIQRPYSNELDCFLFLTLCTAYQKRTKEVFMSNEPVPVYTFAYLNVMCVMYVHYV